MLPELFTPEYLTRLELLKLKARRSFLGTRQGGHISLKRGHGIEFSDYRKYELGDNPRHIDWGVYARSERLYVKRFQEEQNLSVLIVADASPSMITPPEDRKWESARDLALSVSYVALMEQDSVALSVPGILHSPLYAGGHAFHTINRDLGSVSPGKVSNLVREVQRAVSRMRFPGVAIYISDFLTPLDEIEKVFNIMRAKSLDITAVQVLGPHDLEPFAVNEQAIAVDSESGEEVQINLTEQAQADYKEFLQNHIAAVRKYLFGARIPFCQYVTNSDLPHFVLQSLSKTGLLQ